MTFVFSVYSVSSVVYLCFGCGLALFQALEKSARNFPSSGNFAGAHSAPLQKSIFTGEQI
jgi:hypothetical protein